MNLPEKLSREIMRVSAIEGLYAHLADDKPAPGANPVNYGPALLFMRDGLERACTAAGTGDPRAQMDAIKELEGFRL